MQTAASVYLDNIKRHRVKVEPGPRDAPQSLKVGHGTPKV